MNNLWLGAVLTKRANHFVDSFRVRQGIVSRHPNQRTQAALPRNAQQPRNQVFFRSSPDRNRPVSARILDYLVLRLIRRCHHQIVGALAQLHPLT
jgi:hypothetical protein